MTPAYHLRPVRLDSLRTVACVALLLVSVACGDRNPGVAGSCAPGGGAPASPMDTIQFAPQIDIDLARMSRSPSGLCTEDVQEGTGATAEIGQQVVVHYTGWFPDGRVFDSSRESGQPATFALAQGSVIDGWVEGVAGMKVGGRRKLVLPPALAYGEMGHPAGIPPNSTLVFDVELVDVR